MAKRLFFTGGTGFLGANLLPLLAERYEVTLAVAENLILQRKGAKVIRLSQTAKQDWGSDTTVLHFAEEKKRNRLTRFNVELTLKLAEKAKAAEVESFIYISPLALSLKSTEEIQKDPYLFSKLQAETGLQQLLQGADTRLVILRVPEIFGPNDLESNYPLFRLAEKGMRLPLGNVTARRNRLYVGNFCQGILEILQSKNTPGKPLDFVDTEAISLGEFYQRIYNHYQEGEALKTMPLWVLKVLHFLLVVLKKVGASGVWLGPEHLEQFLSEHLADRAEFGQHFPFQPAFGLNQGISATWKWHQSIE